MVEKWQVVVHMGDDDEDIFAVRDTEAEALAALQTFPETVPMVCYLSLRRIWIPHNWADYRALLRPSRRWQ